VIERITIGSRSGVAAYLDDEFQPADRDAATTVKVSFDDGGTSFFSLDRRGAPASKANPRALETELQRGTRLIKIIS
jgi:hypothetical protein